MSSCRSKQTFAKFARESNGIICHFFFAENFFSKDIYRDRLKQTFSRQTFSREESSCHIRNRNHCFQSEANFFASVSQGYAFFLTIIQRAFFLKDVTIGDRDALVEGNIMITNIFSSQPTANLQSAFFDVHRFMHLWQAQLQKRESP